MKRMWMAGLLGLLVVGGVLGQLSQSGGTGNAVSATQSGAWTVGASQSGAWTVTSVGKTACGSTAYDSGIGAMPTSATVVTSTATCVDAAIFVNTTAGAQTVTLTDNQASAAAYLTGFQIPANSTMVYELHHARFANGIKWQAGAAGSVNAQVVGLQ